MSYENAPATAMLATHCAVCRRALLDSLSVEIGIGPVCRERHGYNAETAGLTDDARKAANQIIAHMARKDVSDQDRVSGCAALRVMGFRKVAERIEYHGKDAPAATPVMMRQSSHGTGWYVASPYNPGAVGAFRCIPGRKWDGERKLNFVPNAQRVALWSLLKTHFHGQGLVIEGNGETKVLVIE